jgi:hypothetical protein
MIRYTLTYTHEALSALAREWLNASDRLAVTQAGDEIDRRLSVDAVNQGEEVREGLRRLVVHPLQVQFTVEESDRTVTIWTVRVVASSGGAT